MSSDWAPRLLSANKETPAIQTPITAQKAEPAPVINIEVQPPKVRSWRFVPERDANNLIIEVIATPILD